MSAVSRKLSSGRGLPSALLTFALVVFFLTLADATGMYIVPILLAQKGFTDTQLGLIIGFSSIAGGLFDLAVSLLFRNTNFRRLLLMTFAICFAYPLVLHLSDTIWLFLFAMAIWGVYFDLFNISTFDFVSRYSRQKLHATGFGLIQIFRALGDLLAPLGLGFLVAGVLDWRPFELYWAYLSMALVFFVLLAWQMRGVRSLEPRVRHKHFLLEVRIWRKILRKLLPAFLLTIFLFVIDAFFWTLGPLYAESSRIGGFFLAAYLFPMLIVGWLVGPLVMRFGTKRTAYACLGIGSLILSMFYFAPQASVLVLVFAASIFIGMAMPAINAVYADFIYKDPNEESETEAMEDFSANISYVVGPIAAGYLADHVGLPAAFSLMAAVGVALSLLLFIAAGKKGRI